MNTAFKLFRLQQVDIQLDRALTRVSEIETLLADDRAVQEAAREASAHAKTLDQKQRDLRSAELNTKRQRDKINSTETRLYSGTVKNPKELQDLERESVALKRYLSVLEDRQLEAMLELDEAKSLAVKSKKRLDDVEGAHVENSAALQGEKSKLKQEIKKLEDERQAAAQVLSMDEIGMYERLRNQRGGLAVAKVVDDACAACGTTLNAALLQASKSAQELAHCSTCGRILYGN